MSEDLNQIYCGRSVDMNTNVGTSNMSFLKLIVGKGGSRFVSSSNCMVKNKFLIYDEYLRI